MTSADVQAMSQRFMRTASALPTLYELGEEWNGLIARFEDPEADATEIEAELDRVAGDIKRKGYGLAIVIQALENMAEMQKGEANRQRTRAQTNQSHADRLRDYALNCMKAIGTDHLELGTYTLSIRQNPPAAVIVDEAAVPAEFKEIRTSVYVDKNAIKAHVKATGEVVPGVSIERSESLSLR